MSVASGQQGVPQNVSDNVQLVSDKIFEAVRGSNMNATAVGLEKGMAAVSIHHSKPTEPGALLIAAAKGGNLNVVKDLLDKGADKEAMDENEGTALHYAAEEGYKDVVALLIEKGANKEAKDKKYRCTALHYAAMKGHKDVVALLIEKGANKEANNDQEYGCMAPHYAAYSGHKDVVDALLIEKGSNKAAKSNNGGTALHYAAVRGHKDVVALLIDKGADKEAKDQAASSERLHVKHRNRVICSRRSNRRNGEINISE
ncbi:hypothetical protein CEUSTIGMA_g5180.t1 [Chlamydomonas eustigma]|uniref:Uncharacterized protein n=1 Tax=Chlamydomonas eustigma TaxID=1157962 RepID=A0A250X3T4_9CHLO|nr:hypothetical protein CEUSTIGMA_g5180.t1 [Chlamydomonas eustigma]|eukprot:GAX77737.1 hypothetical protein CEUSTIGMA_g5180.t1 [Chlamydomonas eustigma]